MSRTRPALPAAEALQANYRLNPGEAFAEQYRLLNAAGSKVLTASPARTRRVKTISYTVCGERSLQVRVRRTQGFGPFALTVARP